MKKIRIFAAAPRDVRPEYAYLESLVQQLNKPGEIAGQIGIKMELAGICTLDLPPFSVY